MHSIKSFIIDLEDLYLYYSHQPQFVNCCIQLMLFFIVFFSSYYKCSDIFHLWLRQLS